jgi:carboxyl-terminal processing protease
MEKKRRNIVVFGPVIIAVSILAGILIGVNFQKSDKENRFIIYPKLDKLNSVVNYIEEEYVDEVNKKEIVEATIPKVLEELDPHSVYIPASELKRVNESLQGNFSGIGVQFNMQNDTVAIINTIPNGPSEKVGIMAGDRIVVVDNDTVAGMGMPTDSIVSKLKGPKGTEVHVRIKRRGVNELLDFDIVRDNIPLYSVDVAYMLNDTTGYVKISKFSRTTFNEFLAAVNKLNGRGMQDIVIDLRDNSGGYLDAATNIADQFLEEDQLIVYTQGQARPRQEIRATKGGVCIDKDVVVLLNEWSASASEILAGAIQDNDRGTIVGRRSFGKGLVQEQRIFGDGSAIRLTIARYYTPTGRCIQKPYENGNKEDYYMDLTQRYVHGEFSEEDSIHFADSLKFETPEGKVVYGGGGIMPDVFVALDTTEYSQYYLKVRNKGLIYKFAFRYTDKYRSQLSSLENAIQIQDYLDQKAVLKNFISYAQQQGVKPDYEDIEVSKQIIKSQIYAYIGRNVIDNEGFYPIIRDIDKTLQEGIDQLVLMQK